MLQACYAAATVAAGLCAGLCLRRARLRACPWQQPLAVGTSLAMTTSWTATCACSAQPASSCPTSWRGCSGGGSWRRRSADKAAGRPTERGDLACNYKCEQAAWPAASDVARQGANTRVCVGAAALLQHVVRPQVRSTSPRLPILTRGGGMKVCGGAGPTPRLRCSGGCTAQPAIPQCFQQAASQPTCAGCLSRYI